MNIEARDIISKHTEHYFKDNGAKDLKMGRDCLMMLADVNGQSYYLTLSSHDNNAFEYYQRFPDENYLLTKKNCHGLTYTSCVNVRDIYAEMPLGRMILTVPEDEFLNILDKLKKWQDKNPDPLYGVIKPYI